mgnify:FL=1
MVNLKKALFVFFAAAGFSVSMYAVAAPSMETCNEWRELCDAGGEDYCAIGLRLCPGF